MELTSKRTIKELLETYNAKPEKYLGQHFILSKNALVLILAAAEINSDAKRGRSSDRKRRRKTDTIIEIGPGLGTLTRELAATGAKVIAIEKDPLMISILKETLADYKNVKIIQADARNLIEVIEVGLQSDFKIVANLPYNVATFLIRSWLETPSSPRLRRARPKLMVLMIQKEVAQRICAKPPKMNLLAVSTQFYAIAEIVKYVPKEMFWPRPKVDAAIIKIVPKTSKGNNRNQSIGFKQSFFKVVKAGFSSPRKQLAGNLSKKLGIPKENLVLIFQDLKISSAARAENLTLENWLELTREVIHN